MRTRTLAALAASLLAFLACDKATPVAPSEATLTISANPTRIEPDGIAVIRVIARKADGNAVNPGTEINFATSLGQIDSLVPTDDRGVAEASLRGVGTIGVATVSASSGAAAAVSLDVQIGALASAITLGANPASVSKDPPVNDQGVKEVKISLVATVTDDLGNLLNNASVTFRSPLGLLASEGVAVLTGPESNPDFPDGTARDTLTLDDDALSSVEDFLTVSAEAITTGGGLIEAIADIEVRGFAASIDLTVSSSSIAADGGMLNLSALVRKQNGRAAVNEGVSFGTEVGSLASGGGLILTDGGGQAGDTLTVTAAEIGAFVGNSFTVTAKVAGSGGVEIEDSQTVDIQGNPAVASFTAVLSTNVVTMVEDTVTVSSTTSGAASAADPIKLTWDFGDGTTVTQDQTGATGAPLVHQYTTFTVASGMTETFTITLTAENAFNVLPSEATLEVTVTAP